MNDAERTIDEVLAELRPDARGKRPTPNRYHARALLVALGTLLEHREEPPPETERIRAATADLEGWDAAVDEELRLAAAEHVQGVDPRFLDHPRFDFDYLVEARERLEARFRALEALGLEAPEDLLNRVAEADRVVEPYLRARRGETGAN